MARSKSNGIQCPECKAFGLKVIRTTPGDGFQLRRLVCQCGHRLTTCERPYNQAAPSLTAIDNALRSISIGQLLESVELLRGKALQASPDVV